ncbi:MAG TPA: lysylphosphatidylglycerol synthase domain-containing protein [Gemmataceae bacterium]|nr:lysylphosphatidylglycerol synthase domain-containing protein [Gemmataceae bacterium]
MKRDWKSLAVRGIKLLAAGAILLYIGRRFVDDLEQLDFDTLELRPEWLAISGALYLFSLLPGVWYWHHLHRQFGYPIPTYAALRAHYIAQLGKYVPGKTLALLMRAHLTHPFGVPYGVSIIISFYEVLTMMAAGGIVAAVIYALEPPGDLQLGLHPVAIGAILVGMCGIPLLPAVFNFIVARLSARIQAVELYRLPSLRFGPLMRGLALGVVLWWVQGLSWYAMLQGVLPTPPAFTMSLWAQCTASIAFANVAGFVLIVIPGGLGVREWLLVNLLNFAGPGPYLTAAAILLRLDWIVMEAIFTLCVYWIRPAEPDAQ